MPTDPDQVLDLGSLRRLLPGYAYVAAAEVRGDTAVLRLRYADGAEVLAALPDPVSRLETTEPGAGEPQREHALSVVITNGRQLQYDAILRPPATPRRVPVAAATAWTHARHGVHTVLITRPDPTGRPAPGDDS